MRDPRTFIQAQEQEEKEKNVVDFTPRLITGGKGPSDPKDWLSPLPVGSYFLTQEGGKPGLGEWTIVEKYSKAVRLRLTLPDDSSIVQNIDPVSFCRMNSLYELIREGEDKAEYE